MLACMKCPVHVIESSSFALSFDLLSTLHLLSFLLTHNPLLASFLPAGVRPAARGAGSQQRAVRRPQRAAVQGTRAAGVLSMRRQ
jgi:hypothetical protein